MTVTFIVWPVITRGIFSHSSSIPKPPNIFIYTKNIKFAENLVSSILGQKIVILTWHTVHWTKFKHLMLSKRKLLRAYKVQVNHYSYTQQLCSESIVLNSKYGKCPYYRSIAARARKRENQPKGR